MPVFWGQSELLAGTVHLGQAPVTEIWIGNTQVWPPAVTTLDPVTNLAAVAQNSTDISLSWDAVANAENYIIERRLAPSGPWGQIASVSAPTLIYDDSGAGQPGDTLEYRAYATATGFDNGGLSNVASATLESVALSISYEGAWPTSLPADGDTVSFTANLSALPDESFQRRFILIGVSSYYSEVDQPPIVSVNATPLPGPALAVDSDPGSNSSKTYLYSYEFTNQALTADIVIDDDGVGSTWLASTVHTLICGLEGAVFKTSDTVAEPSPGASAQALSVSANDKDVVWLFSTGQNFGTDATVTGITTNYNADVNTDDVMTDGTTEITADGPVNVTVAAGDGDGDSFAGALVGIGPAPTGPVSQVTGLAASVASGSEIDLTWNVATNAATYSVERSTTGGGLNFTEIASGLLTPSFTDTGLSESTTYYYRVRGTNVTSGPGPYSAEDSATTPALVVITGERNELVANGSTVPAGTGRFATPSTANEGDRCVVLVTIAGNTGTVSNWPSGWTVSSVESGNSFRCYWLSKILTASDVNSYFTYTIGSGGRHQVFQSYSVGNTAGYSSSGFAGTGSTVTWQPPTESTPGGATDPHVYVTMVGNAPEAGTYGYPPNMTVERGSQQFASQNLSCAGAGTGVINSNSFNPDNGTFQNTVNQIAITFGFY